jgi:hypothetical protein
MFIARVGELNNLTAKSCERLSFSGIDGLMMSN